MVVLHKGVVIHRCESTREAHEVCERARAMWPGDDVELAQLADRVTERHVKESIRASDQENNDGAAGPRRR